MLHPRVVAVCGLVFCAELGQAMLFPLLPGISDKLALGPARTGLLLSLATFATLVAAVPAGMLTERVGALRVSLAAGALFAVAAAIQASATGFPALLAGRALFGIGFAAIWTAGIALVSGPGAPRWGVGATMAAGGLAHLVGPPLSGVLAEAFGRSLPFALLAGGSALVTVLAATVPGGGDRRAASAGVREAAGAAVRDPALRGAAVVIALVGLVGALVGLAVPLLLDREGFSSSGIGAVFAAASAVWVVASWAVGRLGAPANGLAVAGIAAVLLAAASLGPVVIVAAPCVVAFMLVRATIQPLLSTLSYQLGAAGARASGLAVGTAMGLLNLLWAVGATVAPLAGGVVLDATGPRWVFVLLAVACLGAALGVRRAGAAARRAVATPAPALRAEAA